MEIKTETPILDIWPLDEITQGVAQAYRRLMDRGLIRLRTPIRVSRHGRIAVFDYFSVMDRTQTHAALRTEADRLEGGRV